MEQKDLLSDCPEEIKKLISEEKITLLDINDSVLPDGQTILHVACQNDCFKDYVQLLLQKDIVIDKTDQKGNTPLLYAAKNDCNEIVDLLVSKGASLNHENMEGNTVWFYLCQVREGESAENFKLPPSSVFERYKNEKKNPEGVKLACKDMFNALHLKTESTKNTKIYSKDLGFDFPNSISSLPFSEEKLIHCHCVDVQSNENEENKKNFSIWMKIFNELIKDKDEKKTDIWLEYLLHYAIEFNVSDAMSVCIRELLKEKTTTHKALTKQYIFACENGILNAIRIFRHEISDEKYSSLVNFEIEGEVPLISFAACNLAWTLNSKEDLKEIEILIENTKSNNHIHYALNSASQNMKDPVNFALFAYLLLKRNGQKRFPNQPLLGAAKHENPMFFRVLFDLLETMNCFFDINLISNKKSADENLLYLLARPGFEENIKILILNGFNLAQQDNKGNSFFHLFIKKNIVHVEYQMNAKHLSEKQEDLSKKLGNYIKIIDLVFLYSVHWWTWFNGDMGEENINRRNAVLYLIHDVRNNKGFNVMQTAFKKGSAAFLGHIFETQNILKFSTNRFCYIDMTNILPDTIQIPAVKTNQINTANNLYNGKMNNQQKKTKKYEENKTKCCLEMLQYCKENSAISSILALEPLVCLIGMYEVVCIWFFLILLLLHVSYMIGFTNTGIAMTIVLNDVYYNNITGIIGEGWEEIWRPSVYALVPLEPILGLIFFVIYLFRLCKERKIEIKSLPQYILLLIYISFIFGWIAAYSVKWKYHDYLLATSLFMGWSLSLNLTRGFKKTHYFYRMIVRMLFNDILAVLVVYLFVLVSFGFAMHILVMRLNLTGEEFSDAGDTIFTGFNLMMGRGALTEDDGALTTALHNFNNADGILVKILYLLYILLSIIILLNLVIALMNTTYEHVHTQHRTDWPNEVVLMGILVTKYLKCSCILKKFGIKKDFLPENCFFYGEHFMEVEEEKYINVKKRAKEEDEHPFQSILVLRKIC